MRERQKCSSFPCKAETWALGAADVMVGGEMAGVVARGGDVQNVRKRGTAKTDAEISFFTLWGKSHTAISLGIVPVCSSGATASDIGHRASGTGSAPSVLPGCLLAVLEWSGREFTCVTWAETQLESGKRAGAGLMGLLHLASPPGQEPAHFQVPCLNLTHGPSCAKRSDLFA